jgi:hypothetical protein
LNDQLDLALQSEPAVQQAYQTACRWYTHRRLSHLFRAGSIALDPVRSTSGTIARPPRRSILPTLTAKHLLELLTKFVEETGTCRPPSGILTFTRTGF